MRAGRTINAWCAAGLCLGLLLQSSGAADPALASQLADEGDWAACRLEYLRLELEEGGGAEVVRLRAQAEAGLADRRGSTSIWKRLGALPVVGMVGFYRLMVAPALGARCILEPSCSRYSMQAARERGWLGIPMTGDRLIREPSVIVARENPVEDDHGHVRFADPVSDHIGGGYGSGW